MKGHTRQLSGIEAVLLTGLGLICVANAHAVELSRPAVGPEPAVQAGDASAERTSPGRLKEVVVTGTLIPTAPDAVAVPVTTLNADAMKQTGITNALEMLTKAIPDFAGRSNAGASNARRTQFTAGASQLELRNLPTLVLVNGERLAIDAVGAFSGSKDFVDVSQIPVAALQRIDVLTDGASSLYGSDAIGGVVNFILKHDYHGVSAGIHYGTADGGYHEIAAHATGGVDIGPVNVTATAGYSKSTPLWQSARSFTSPLYGVVPGTGLPGVVGAGSYVLAPGLSSPSVPTGTAAKAASYSQLAAQGIYEATSPASLSNGFDFSRYAMLLQQQEQESFVANISSKSFFDGRMKAFGDVILSRNRVYSTAWAAPGKPFSYTSLTVPADAPYNPLTTSATGVTFADLSRPKGVFDTTDAYHVNAGLKGKLTSQWVWQTSLDYSESKLTELNTNLLYSPNIVLADAGGYDSSGNPLTGGGYSKVHGGYSVNSALVLQPALNPFAVTGNSAAALANIFGTEVLHGDSKLYSWDAHAAGSLLRLPAGQISVAIGVNWRREELSGHADPNGRTTDPVTGLTTGNDQNWIGGVFTNPFTHGRDDSALYGETRVPITSSRMSLPGLREFELTAAGRFEHYSDTGSGTTPKFGFRWEPFNDQLIFHGTYTKSFVAPPLFQAYGPFDMRQVTGNIPASVFGDPALKVYTFNGEDGNNPNLKPATSVSRSVGFVFRPHVIDGLALTADFSSINLYGFAGGIGFNNIINSVDMLGSASPFFANLGEGNFANFGGKDPFTTPGALAAYLKANPANLQNLYVEDRFTNLAVLKERSWTIGAVYILPWSRYGTWTLATNGAVFESFKFSDGLGDPTLQYAGNASNSGVFAGTLPKFRFYSTVEWVFHGLNIVVANTHISSVEDAGVNGNLPGIPVSSYSAWDLRGSYDWSWGSDDRDRTVTATLGVNNITNAMPPIFPRAFTNQFTTSDIGTYSPLGRLVYADLSVTL